MGGTGADPAAGGPLAALAVVNGSIARVTFATDRTAAFDYSMGRSMRKSSDAWNGELCKQKRKEI